MAGFYDVDLKDDLKMVRLGQKENGECVYLTLSGRCSIYKNRPQVCREYSCMGDERLIPYTSDNSKEYIRRCDR
ncbi:MAG: YkgJ family cysteine cluster protein [Desulfobacterales bacterium]|nr:YkgJ family cysteine cluster protein [Desulfobacterales bacterium]